MESPFQRATMITTPLIIPFKIFPLPPVTFIHIIASCSEILAIGIYPVNGEEITQIIFPVPISFSEFRNSGFGQMIFNITQKIASGYPECIEHLLHLHPGRLEKISDVPDDHLMLNPGLNISMKTSPELALKNLKGIIRQLNIYVDYFVQPEEKHPDYLKRVKHQINNEPFPHSQEYASKIHL